MAEDLDRHRPILDTGCSVMPSHNRGVAVVGSLDLALDASDLTVGRVRHKS